MPRGPVGIDAIHLPDDAITGEAMNEGYVVGLPVVPQNIQVGEGRRLARTDPHPDFIAAGVKKMLERTAAPLGRGFAVARGFILDNQALLDAIVPPPEGASFIDGVQC